MKRKTTLLLLLLFAAFSMTAQNSSQGKEFWISFMQNGYRQYDSHHSAWVENTVMVSAKRACTGTITRTCGQPGSIDFSVDDNGIVFIDIPESWAYNEGNEEVVDNKSIVLRATDTVSVFISNLANYSFDASFVLPVESLGAEYIIQSDQQCKTDNINSYLKETSSFLIVAVEDDTEVEIMPSVKTVMGHGAGVPYTITMSAGQTYFVRSNNNSEWRDLSGSTVFARNGKKVAVFNGNTITRIPGNAVNGRDHIFEQALPIDSWGRRFVVTSSEGRARDIVKITSSADDNCIYRDGEEIAIIGYGESWEFDLLSEDGSCFVETSEPSVVYVYHTSWQDPFEPSTARQGDPSMVWIPPVEQRIDEVTFCTFDNDHDFGSIASHYVNVVVHRLDAHKLYIDGELVAASEFQPVVGNDDFCFVRKAIAHGTHRLACESGLIAHVYGFGEARGYAYCVGANMLQLNGKMYVNGIWSGSYRHGLYMCHDEEVTMRVVANYAIDRVDWVFDDGLTATGEETSHRYAHAGDYVAEAHVVGFNTLTLEPVYDTMRIILHVGEPYLFDETVVGCDSIHLFGEVYDHSMHQEYHGTSICGCDSTFILTVDIIGAAPQFEIVGNHWPIGGSEIYVSKNDYAVSFYNSDVEIDTVIWAIDNPHWLLEAHGKGETCTLSIYTYLLEPVMLHAMAINACDTIHETFFIQTSYYGVGENDGNRGIEVFPNPTKGNLTLRFNDMHGSAEVVVYNALGQKVDTFSVNVDYRNETTYDMKGLSNGLYYFVMRNEGTSLTRKVMLER